VALSAGVGGAVAGLPSLPLLQPEKMTPPFLNNPAGSYTMSKSGFKWLDGYASASASSTQFTLNNTLDGVRRGVSHATMWETAPPQSISGEDVYTIKVFAATNWDSDPDPLITKSRTQFFVTPIKVYVSNPKTVSAAIRSIVRDTSAPNAGATVAGPGFGATGTQNFFGNMFEPVVVGDGRLLVTRVGTGSLPWTDENGVVRATQGCDIVYSYYTSAQGDPADPSKWTTLMPISHAPYDARINTKFGFAMAPFRDPEGTLIPDGEDIGGTYPWIDREAKNLFFEAGGDQLRYQGTDGWWDKSRYPMAAVPEQAPLPGIPDPKTNVNTNKPEAGGKHEMVVYCGLWSHGKVVLFDNMVNDTDYAVGAGDNSVATLAGPEQRMVQLYQADAAPQPGWLAAHGLRALHVVHARRGE